MNLNGRLNRLEMRIAASDDPLGECSCGESWAVLPDRDGNVPADVHICPKCRRLRSHVLIVDTGLVKRAWETAAAPKAHPE